MTPLVFLDTETDGLHPGRRAWEVAMIRRDDTGQTERTFFVGLDLQHSDPFGLKIGGFWDRHPIGRKLSGKDPHPGPIAMSSHDAAREVMRVTFGAHIVGLVPNFDTEVLARLLRSQGYLPSWHYHLIDVETMAVGWLNALTPDDEPPLEPPWKSDELSLECGVEPPAEADRHTALGDARWAMRWYDALTGGAL